MMNLIFNCSKGENVFGEFFFFRKIKVESVGLKKEK